MSSSTNPESSLPPGFRFHPTDEELILHYLKNKASSTPYPISIIAEVDIYKFDPWELPARAMFGDKEWYFFSPRDRKYPKGARPNRSAASGYWKATGTDKPIYASKGDQDKNIGIKKALVFYMGKPPKGLKTNWIMHEYRLSESPNYKPVKLNDSSMRLDEWVLCRIYKKSNSLPTITISDQEEQAVEDLLMPSSLSNLPINQNTNLMIKPQKSTSFSDLFDAMGYSTLSHHMLLDPSFDQIGSDFGLVLNYGDPNQSISINKNNDNYYLNKVPQIDYSSSSVQVMQNQLKRQHPMTTTIIDDDDEDSLFLHPSKKSINSCNFNNNNNTSRSSTNQLDTNQNQILQNQQYLNQQLLMSSHHLQF